MDNQAKMMDNQAMKKKKKTGKTEYTSSVFDKTANSGIRLAEGFVNQILHIFPLPTRQTLREHPLTHALHVLAIGSYPNASHHYRERPSGCDEHILILCTHGEGWFEMAGRRQMLAAHQAVVIPRRTPHRYGASEQNPWSIAWVHFSGDEADYYCSCLPVNGGVIPLSSKCEREVVGQFRAAYSAIARDYTVATLIVLAQILRYLLSILFFRNGSYSPHFRIANERDLRSTVTYMTEQGSTALTLAELARHAGLSERTFTRHFHQQIGMAPMHYVIQQRIRKACQWLAGTSLTVSEIALQSGYDDPYYFSRLFRKETGQSPKQYRAQHENRSVRQ